MKILHITVRADMGGGPKHIQYLMDSLKELYPANIDNYIATPIEEPFYNIFEEIVGTDNLFIIPHRKFSIKRANELKKNIINYKINIIHCHGKGASVYGKYLKFFLKNKIKVIYTAHGLQFSKYNSFFNKINVIYEKYTICLIDFIIYVSESELELAHKYNFMRKVSSQVIPNGVALQKKPNFTKEEREIFINKCFPNYKSNNCSLIMTASRFDYQKNMEECLKIAQKFPHYYFVWFGNGKDFEYIKNLIEINKLTNICLFGNTNNMIYYMQYADLYLSTSRWEGMPLALLEAMSLGIPILASDVVGNSDLVNETTGLKYSLGDINDAGKLLDKLIKNKMDHDKIRNYFKATYSSSVMAQKVYKIYYNLIS